MRPVSRLWVPLWRSERDGEERRTRTENYLRRKTWSTTAIATEKYPSHGYRNNRVCPRNEHQFWLFKILDVSGRQFCAVKCSGLFLPPVAVICFGNLRLFGPILFRPRLILWRLLLLLCSLRSDCRRLKSFASSVVAIERNSRWTA